MELNTYSNVLCGGSSDFPAPCLLSVFEELSFKRRGRVAWRDETGAGQGPPPSPGTEPNFTQIRDTTVGTDMVGEAIPRALPGDWGRG